MPDLVDLPPGRVVHTVLSPGFAYAPPDVTHEALIDPSIRPGLTATWSRAEPPRVTAFHSVPDVYVVGEGLVFDREQRLLQPSVTQTPPAMVEAAAATLRAAVQAGTVVPHAGPLVLCGKAGLNNYGHWLAEMLPRAFLSLPWIGLDHGWRVLVPQTYPWMRAVIEDSLDLLGAGAGKRVLGDGSPCHVSELVMLTGMTEHGQYFSPLVLGAMDRIAATVPAGAPERLWISRAGERRCLLDEERAQERIAAAGWTVVHPGRLGFREQVALAKGARHMAGVNGAGLANLLFMRRGGSVTSFVPAVMPDIFYWQLANHRGLRYREVRSLQAHELGGPTIWDAPLTIPLDEVLRQLDQSARL